MQAFLESAEINASDAWTLFASLDVDGDNVTWKSNVRCLHGGKGSKYPTRGWVLEKFVQKKGCLNGLNSEHGSALGHGSRPANKGKRPEFRRVTPIE